MFEGLEFVNSSVSLSRVGYGTLHASIYIMASREFDDYDGSQLKGSLKFKILASEYLAIED